MKNTLLLTFLVFALQAQAQFGKDPLTNLENWDKQRVHWGYFLGFNSYDFKIDYKDAVEEDIAAETNIGFNVGLIGNLRINEYFDLRFEPGLYYAQRDLTFPGFEKTFDAERPVKSTFIHFPLLVKYSALRTGNIRPFLLAGVSSTLNLSSNSNTQEDNVEQRFRVKQWTNNYELGFGIDLYFEYFKFSPSIRGVFGLKDELIRDNNPNSPWTGNIESMKTRAIMVNFTFQ